MPRISRWLFAGYEQVWTGGRRLVVVTVVVTVFGWPVTVASIVAVAVLVTVTV